MTSVCPALWPPWKRTTMSASSDSQSTILPLPSSPHWAPITTTFAIKLIAFRRGLYLSRAAKNERGANWLLRGYCEDGVHSCAAGVKICALGGGLVGDAPVLTLRFRDEP